jgi:S-DNA-T family DNA segregation ATPase FtsK/SpoIIIE
MRFAFPWGGAFGESTYVWLSSFMGDVGLFCFLTFVIGVWVIWRFNPKVDSPGLSERVKVPWPSLFAFLKRSKPARAFAGIDSVDVPEKTVEPLKPTFFSAFRSIQREVRVEDPVAADTAFDFEEEFDLDIQHEHPRTQAAQQNTQFEVAEPSTADTSDEDLSEQEFTVIPPNMNPNPQVTHVEEDNIDHSEPYDPTKDLSEYQHPDLELLHDYAEENVEIDRAELEANKDQIIATLLNYKIEITKIRATIGPTVTLYEIVPAAGVRISRIKNLEDDIALSLAALGIRIIAPIPGKGSIGI